MGAFDYDATTDMERQDSHVLVDRNICLRVVPIKE